MKKKHGKYLKFYKECMKTGRLPVDMNYKGYGGLCFCLHGGDPNELIVLFEPPKPFGYWGYNGDVIYDGNNVISTDDLHFEFTELRQTIVLFMAAMNNEL